MKSEFYQRVVEELNLDTSDPFTNLLANACALVDQRDQLQSDLGKASLNYWATKQRTVKAERDVAGLRALLREVYGEFAKRHIRAADLQERIDAALAARQEERKEGNK